MKTLLETIGSILTFLFTISILIANLLWFFLPLIILIYFITLFF